MKETNHPVALDNENQDFIPPIEIKPEFLTADVLNSVVQEFVLREGTNYGLVEHSSETKVQQVIQQIKKGDVKIVFDPQSESVTLMTSTEFKKAILKIDSKNR